MTVATRGSESPVRGLHASAPEPLPFAPSLHVRAFLLRRDAGNVQIYSAPTVDADTFAHVGGTTRAYFNHRHEASFGRDLPGVPLYVHEAERCGRASRAATRLTTTWK